MSIRPGSKATAVIKRLRVLSSQTTGSISVVMSVAADALTRQEKELDRLRKNVEEAQALLSEALLREHYVSKVSCGVDAAADSLMETTQ
jgi:hypothetical protein